MMTGRLFTHAYKHGMRICFYALGLAGQRKVWLTFDDGPHPDHTPRILEALNKRSIRARFFVVGERAEKHLDIVRDAFSAGHRIGNHSFTHPDLSKLDRGTIYREITRTNDVITQYSHGDKIFRPPYGARNRLVDSVVSELGYRTVMWDASTRDWNSRYQPERWVRRGTMMIRLGGGSSILLHDNLPGTSGNIGHFLDAVQGLGDVQFMTSAPQATTAPTLLTDRSET